MNTLPAPTLVIGGNPLQRRGLVAIVGENRGLTLCGDTGEPAHARQLCVEHQPELIVTDLELPAGDGLGLVREFIQLCPAARILALSEREDASWLQRAFQAGASGYALKNDESRELANGMWQVFHGEKFVSRAMSTFVLGQFTNGKKPAAADGRKSLSNREMAVLRAIAEGHGPTAIADALGVTVKTIESHLGRMKAKLGARTGEDLRRHAAEWLRGKGRSLSAIAKIILAATLPWMDLIGDQGFVF